MFDLISCYSCWTAVYWYLIFLWLIKPSFYRKRTLPDHYNSAATAATTTIITIKRRWYIHLAKVGIWNKRSNVAFYRAHHPTESSDNGLGLKLSWDMIMVGSGRVVGVICIRPCSYKLEDVSIPVFCTSRNLCNQHAYYEHTHVLDITLRSSTALIYCKNLRTSFVSSMMWCDDICLR